MDYTTLIDNYTPELQLMDALDMLKHFEPKAAEILDQWASESNTERIDGEPLQMGPTQLTFSQDIQLLSTDWEPQYKSQGDSINISWNDSDEELVLESLCKGPDTYPVPYDVDLPTDLHLSTTSD